MGLILEAFLVVIRKSSMFDKITKFDEFSSIISDATINYDDELFSIMYYKYKEAKELVEFLLLNGLSYDDVALATQIDGLLTPSDWLNVGSTHMIVEGSFYPVNVVYLDEEPSPFIVSVPGDWEYEGSLSNWSLHLSDKEIDERLILLNEKDGVLTYYDKGSDSLVYAPKSKKGKKE